MSDNEKRYVLRLSDELYRKIEEWANEERRSVNQQMVVILENAVIRRIRRQATQDEVQSEEDIQMPELVGAEAA